MSLSVQASLLFSNETVPRSQLHKKNKNLHLKEEEKPKLNLYRNLFYSLHDRSLFPLNNAVYIGEIER